MNSITTDIYPFTIEIAQASLDDLTGRLARTRFADELPADLSGAQAGPLPPGWEYGVPATYVRQLVERWQTFDWRAVETRLNHYPQFVTGIDGQKIHFLHIRSAAADATPLILVHGWPNTVVEFENLIGPLTDPDGHGAAPGAPAFNLVIPSLPGFGFSGPTRQRGWNRHRTARAFATLMQRLAYTRYGVHGNDVGSYVGPELGRQDPEHVIGVHVTQLFSFPSGDPAEFARLTADEMVKLQFLQTFNEQMSAYAKLQETQPMNVAHALADSPAGQLAWIAQLLAGTSDDHVLTNASIYWLTNTGASSARFYWEDAHSEHPTEPTTAPTALASFAHDFTPLRVFAERDHANIVSWNEFDRGSHWATQDAPDLLTDDIRRFFAGRD